MEKIVYSSNNSGGYWWLADYHWKKLEESGWKVEWIEGGFLGAKAKTAYRLGLTLEEAISEWSKIVGMDPYEEGCSCCGQPHWFDVEKVDD